MDTHKLLSLLAPTSALREWGKGCWTVSLSLRGGRGPTDPPVRNLADALDTIQYYRQLWTIIYTDGSAVDAVRHGVAQL
jgi:hypothetical protein